MLTFEPLSNQMCRNSAVAVEALADVSDSLFIAFARGNSIKAPAKSTVSGPSLFSAGWSNPNASLGFAVVNQQSPFSLEFGDVAVGNSGGFEGVDDNQMFIVQNQFGSNPDHSCCESNQGCCSYVENEVASRSRIKDCLCHKNGDKTKGNEAKSKIALRAVNRQFVHTSIISGSSEVGKGK